MPMMIASSPGAISHPTPTPITRLMSQPKMAAAAGPPAEHRELDLGPGDEEQHRQPQLRQRGEERVRVRPAQDRRAEEDAEQQLEDDDRHPHPSPQPSRQQRRENGEERNDDQCRPELVHALTLAMHEGSQTVAAVRNACAGQTSIAACGGRATAGATGAAVPRISRCRRCMRSSSSAAVSAASFRLSSSSRRHPLVELVVDLVLEAGPEVHRDRAELHLDGHVDRAPSRGRPAPRRSRAGSCSRWASARRCSP